MRFLIALALLIPVCAAGQSLIDSLKHELKRPGIDQRNQADLLISLADESRQVSPDSSLYYAQKAFEIIHKEGFDDMAASALNAISTAYNFKGLYDTSIAICFRAIEYGKVQPDKKPLIKAYNGLAINHYYRNDLEESGKYFELSYELAKKEDFPLEEANALQNIGLVKGILGNVDEEVANYKKARQVFVEMGFLEGIGNIDMNLGTTLVPQGKYDSGLYYFESARQIFDSLDQTAGLSVVYTNLAQTYQAMGNLKKAEENALRSIELSQALELKNEERYTTEILSQIYKGMGDYRQAYEMLLRNQALKDTIFNQEKLAQIEKLKVEYDTEQKESEIALLNASSEIKDQRFLATAIGGVLILIVLIVLYSRYMLKNKLSLELAQKNQIITQSLSEKETLLKEIHHRVKNNLQIIESLLSLQHATKGNKKPEDLLKVSQDRIHAISAIHEKLYKSENLREIDFKTYVDELVTHFADTYQIQSVKFKASIDNVDLDLDQLIPCGLIINELITNSLKYAFEKTEEAVIEINGAMKENAYQLEISDNGVGFTEKEDEGSLGLRLVRSLVDQLDGTIEKLDRLGTSYRISFSL